MVNDRLVSNRLRNVRFSQRTSRFNRPTSSPSVQPVTQQQKEQEEETIELLKKLRTYPGASADFTKRLFSKSPQYASVTLKGAGTISLPYFTGTYEEYNPNTNEIITRRVDNPTFGSRGNPLNPEGQVISTRKLNIISQDVADVYNKQAQNWVQARNFSAEIAARQKQDIGARLAKEREEKQKKAEQTPGTTAYARGIVKYQEERAPYNRSVPTSKKLSIANYAALRRVGLSQREIRNLKTSSIKPALKQIAKKKAGYYSERDKRLARELLKVGIVKNINEKIRLYKKYTKRTNKLLAKEDYTPKDAAEARLMYNWITAMPKLKGLEGLSQKLDLLREKQLSKISSTRSEFERQTRFIVGLGILGGLRGAVDVLSAIRHPIKTGVSIYQQFRHPVVTVRETAHEFAIDPVGTIVQFYVFGKGMDLIGTGVKRSPVGKYVQEEVFIQSQPKELRKPIRNIIKAADAQKALNPYKVKEIKSVDFVDVKSLTKTEARALRSALKQTDSVVFGSKAGRILSKNKLPKPKDVDLATRNIKTFSKKFIDNLPKKLRGNYILKGEKLIRKSNGEALFDVKPLSRLMPSRSLLTKRGFLPVSGYVNVLEAPKGSILPRLKKKPGIASLEFRTQKLVDIKGVKLISFGEQTLRKALGTIQVLIEKNAKRAKDPQSFVRGLQIQLEALRDSKPKTPLGRLMKQRRIKVIKNAIKLLTSRQFMKLLEKKVPGLLREYPLLEKIDTRKLRRTEKISREKILREYRNRKKKPTKFRRKKGKIRKKKRKPRKLSKRKPSRLPKKKPSRLPKRKPSRLPKRKPSRLPKKKPSRLQKRKPSRLPKKKPSRLPKRKTSKLPIRKPSRLPIRKPSRLPIRKPSRLPKRKPSRLPLRKPSKIPVKKRSKLPKKKPKTIRLSKKEQIKGAFNVFVKKQGRKARYQRINKKPLNFINANNLGKYVVDQTPLASYRIIQTSGKIGQKFQKKTPNTKFRLQKGRSILPRKAIVEKSKYRIDTRGEKKGITTKGLRKLSSQSSITAKINSMIKKKKNKKRRK